MLFKQFLLYCHKGRNLLIYMHFLRFSTFSITSYNFSVFFSFSSLALFKETPLTAKECADFFYAAVFGTKVSKSFSWCERSFRRFSYIVLVSLISNSIFSIVFPVDASRFISFVSPDLSFALLSQQLRQQLPIVVKNSGGCVRGTFQLCEISSLDRTVTEQIKESF